MGAAQNTSAEQQDCNPWTVWFNSELHSSYSEKGVAFCGMRSKLSEENIDIFISRCLQQAVSLVAVYYENHMKSVNTLSG
jgi:hypothetical protein